MYIIIVGGGRLGYSLTKALLNEGHEVLLIEKNADICDRVYKEMGSVCLRGDGCETAVQAEAGTGRADMLIAVTGDDEDNLVACQVAKYRFNVPRTIARVRNPRNEVIFKQLGVDVTVNSTNIILERIEHEVPSHPLTHLLTMQDKDLEIVEIKIPPGAPAAGKALSALSLPAKTTLAVILRQNSRPIAPRADTVILAGDHIVAVTPDTLEAELRKTLLGETKD